MDSYRNATGWNVMEIKEATADIVGIPEPEINIEETTLTTLTLAVDSRFSLVSADCDGNTFFPEDGRIVITGLRPATLYTIDAKVLYNGFEVTSQVEASTLPIGLDVTAIVGPTHIILTGEYTDVDATIAEHGFIGGNSDSDTLEKYGLDPETEYTFTYYVVTEEGERYAEDYTFKTTGLTMMVVDKPTVICVENGRSNAMVSVRTNIDDSETNAGFEWRRDDAPADMQWNKALIPLYDGVMEGYIRNVQADKYWRVRPFYESASGRRYYGDDIPWDPNDISYCDPVVHTSRKVKISKNAATVEGYALSGTSNITSQGMKYWKWTDGGSEAGEKEMADAATVKAENGSEVMSVDISGLEYDATYSYVAFVMTADGKTYYGETRVFTTEPSPADVNLDGVVDISDIVAVINHIAGTNTYKHADVNGDTKVDISDIVAIINAIAEN